MLLFALLFGSCVEYGHTVQGVVDIFAVPERHEVDVLLVVDNSSSMQPYQAQLGANFEPFILPFLDGNIDYHVAVTTTDDGNDATVVDPARGAFVAPVITAEMDLVSAESTFRSGVNVGTDGSGFEVGLKTAWLALTDEANLGEQIAGFLREDASLSIIFVSDEEDQSPWPVDDYVNAFWQLKGHRARHAFNASALTVTDTEQCAAGTTSFSTPGTRYVDVVDQTLGVSGNLCSGDFAQLAIELGIANTQVLDTYFLSAEPESATLAVSVGLAGIVTVLPCESGGWMYDRVGPGALPAVVFDRDHLPEPGGRLSISYVLGDGSAESFCRDGG